VNVIEGLFAIAEIVDHFEDITYHRAKTQGTVRIAFHRPEVRNAFRPKTVDELYEALDHARRWSDVGCVLLTGNGPSPKDGGWAFCSGGDQRIRGKDGYKYEGAEAHTPDPAQARAPAHPRGAAAHPLHAQGRDRRGAGWAVGGGHSLHVVCDMTLASAEHAVFKQTDPDVGSFDSGYGSALLARRSVRRRPARSSSSASTTRPKRAPHGHGQQGGARTPSSRASRSSGRRIINSKSPTAMRMLKYAALQHDRRLQVPLVGQQIFAGEPRRLAYMTDEAIEGRGRLPREAHYRRTTRSSPGTTERTVLSDVQTTQLAGYVEALLRTNEALNLTAIRDADEAWTRHILESLELVASVRALGAKRCVDLGTGGGVPGMPLAIAMPDTEWLLIDAREKKIAFIAETAKALGVTNVRAVASRAELLVAKGKTDRDHADLLVARALAPMPVLVELALPFVRVGGHMLAVKGERAEEELAQAKRALESLGGEVVHVARRETATHVLVKKVRATPPRFPRQPGQAKRAPL
jgi:naphthoate synthase